MIDPDISTRDALRLLTVDDDPRQLSRRRFLQLVGAGAAAGAFGGTVLDIVGEASEAWAGTPVGPTDGILVLVGLFGGSDGLNVVVPYADSNYYTQHGSLAVPAASVLKIDTRVGLNPNLAYVKSLYDKGEVAVVQGVGYPNPDLSHFTSMALWMAGKLDSYTPSTGWIGRWLDGLSTDELMRAATIGSGLPLHLLGRNRRGVSVPPWGAGFGGGTGVQENWMYDAIRKYATTSAARGAWHDMAAATTRNVLDVSRDAAPAFARTLPTGDLEKKLTIAARLINADVGLRVVDAGYDGYDTHAGQPTAFTNLLVDLDRAIKAFFTTLDDRFRSRVTIMTYSEFGRTSWSNDSAGTDHGTSNNHFVIGRGVKGGLYGAQPSLAGLGRWDRMPFGVDFRSMYASVLDGWMGGGSSTVLGGTFSNLGLFKQAPGVGVATGAVPSPVLGDFVGLAPARVYDSRLAPRAVQVGAGTTAEATVLGVGGVPATGVTAVAVSISATGGSTASTLSAFPTGGAKPDTSHVIVPTTTASTSTAIVPVGRNGRINVWNDLGSADCVVDVVGYFASAVTATSTKLTTVTAARLMDTRSGTGGKTGAFAAATSFDLTVRGVAGVPTTATVVVLNVTAVTPTANGSLTAWSAGTTRPTVPSVSFSTGNTVSNLVIARVSSKGMVSIYNSAGSTHVVVDVQGYFAPSTTTRGRYRPMTPGRLLDTRPDTVAPLGAASTTNLQVLGAAGVPATGVSAVALSITAHQPTAATNLTCWPSLTTRPTTANVNGRVGTATTNLAVVKVGTDGKVSLYNSAGTVDAVVDVLGYFTA